MDFPHFGLVRHAMHDERLGHDVPESGFAPSQVLQHASLLWILSFLIREAAGLFDHSCFDAGEVGEDDGVAGVGEGAHGGFVACVDGAGVQGSLGEGGFHGFFERVLLVQG